MRRVGRHIEVAVDARRFERFRIGLGVAAEASAAAAAIATQFTAAVADEHHLDLLLEGSHVGDVRRRDAAAAEDADVRELVEVGQRDRPGLHAAHGEAGHGAIRLIRQGAEVGINEGDQVVDQNPRESAEVEHASAGTASARRSALVAPAGGGICCAGGSRSATRAGSAGDVAVGHHDDEGLGFALGDQVVHDQPGVALAAPAGFVLAAAVLQIQHRITLGRVLLIIRRGVNEAAEHGVGALGMVERLPQLAMRHVLDGIEVLVLGGDFDAAAPPAAAVEVQAAGIRDSGSINHELVVVETFVLGPRDADPGAVVALGQGVLCAAQELEARRSGLRRDDAGADAAFRVDLGILFAGLVERRWLEVLHRRLVGLGQAELARQQAASASSGEFVFMEFTVLGDDGCHEAGRGGFRWTRYLAAAAFFASAMTAWKAGLGWLLPSNSSGLPLARQEFASFGPQNVTTFTDLSCFRNARKRPA